MKMKLKDVCVPLKKPFEPFCKLGGVKECEILSGSEKLFSIQLADIQAPAVITFIQKN